MEASPWVWVNQKVYSLRGCKGRERRQAGCCCAAAAAATNPCSFTVFYLPCQELLFFLYNVPLSGGPEMEPADNGLKLP